MMNGKIGLFRFQNIRILTKTCIVLFFFTTISTFLFTGMFPTIAEGVEIVYETNDFDWPSPSLPGVMCGHVAALLELRPLDRARRGFEL